MKQQYLRCNDIITQYLTNKHQVLLCLDYEDQVLFNENIFSL